jgi:hypothetical protein
MITKKVYLEVKFNTKIKFANPDDNNYTPETVTDIVRNPFGFKKVELTSQVITSIIVTFLIKSMNHDALLEGRISIFLQEVLFCK